MKIIYHDGNINIFNEEFSFVINIRNYMRKSNKIKKQLKTQQHPFFLLDDCF